MLLAYPGSRYHCPSLAASTAASAKMINVRKMRYTGEAMAALKTSDYNSRPHKHASCKDGTPFSTAQEAAFANRSWIVRGCEPYAAESPESGRNIGPYPLTSTLSPWVSNA